jgi:hypothetical protein
VSRFAKVIVLVSALCWPGLSEAADLSLQWDPPIDALTAGYIVLLGVSPGSYSQQTDVGYTMSHTLTNLSDGTTYYLAVRAYDAMGVMSDLSNEINATARTPVVNSLALTSSVPSPQVLGTTVNWLATPTGGVTPYQYQFALYSGGAWTTGSWTTSSGWTWTPSTAASDYQIRVAVRSSGSASTTGELWQSVPYTITAPAPVVTAQDNLPSPQIAGTTILWTASASGGITPYQYRWWVYDGKTWSAATVWTTTSTWSWKPTKANSNYVVKVGMRSAGQSSDTPQASATVSFPISPAPAKCTRKCK